MVKVLDSGNSFDALPSGVTMQNAKAGRLSKPLASGEMGWVTWDAERQPRLCLEMRPSQLHNRAEGFVDPKSPGSGLRDGVSICFPKVHKC